MPQIVIWDVTLLPAPSNPRLRRPPAPRPSSPAPSERLVARFELALAHVHQWLVYLESKPVRARFSLDFQRQSEVTEALILTRKAISRERGLAAVPFYATRSMRLTYEQARQLLLIAMDRLLGLHARHVERGMPDFPPDPEEAPRRLLRPRRPPPPRRIVRPPAVRQPSVRPLPPPERPDDSRFERMIVRSRGLASDFDPGNYPPPWLRAQLRR